jgi:hypothetical protein
MAAGVWLGGGVAFLVVGCAPDDPPAQQDLPDEKVLQNIDQRIVYVNPDAFPNVIAFCDGPTRLYVTSRDTQSPLAINNHPLCTRGGS